MDLESPQWDRWESQFMALAEDIPETKERYRLSETSRFLNLYGDNGLNEDEEFAELSAFETEKIRLLKVYVETSYWQETVLFIPE